MEGASATGSAGGSSDPPPGTQVLNDRYEILRPLGRGGMGAVYLVYDRQEGREIALKSFPPAARRVEDLAHFEHEFLTLSRLRHPNIAEVYDFGVIEGTQDVFFTSEFIDGRDLLAWSEGLEEAELAPLLVQVCRGLEYIHSREIIHYDVKPSNILVCGTRAAPLVKLIDFGLAAQRVDASLGVIKGTVSYLAPEVARHLRVDSRVDLYSLGATVFHCVTRRLPFSGETNLDVVRRVVSDDPPDPQALQEKLSDGLRGIILRLLAKDPGARYQSGNDLIRALGKLYRQDYDTEPVEAALTFVASGGFFGRESVFQRLTGAFQRIFSWRDANDPLAELPPVLSTAKPGSSSANSSVQGFSRTSSGGFVLDLSSEKDALPSGVGPVPETASAIERAQPFLEAVSPEPEPEPAPPPPEEEGTLPHVLLVRGEQGVGKTRLLKEFKTHAQLRRVAVVEGHAGHSLGAYAAFVEVFRGVLGLWSDAEAGPLRPRQKDPLRRRLLQRYGPELVRLIPELDDSFLPVTHRAQLSPEEEELRLLDALAQFLIGYSRTRPLVILLHELEAADPETLELLRYLCRNLALIESARALSRRTPAAARPLRLLVVGSYRASELEGKPQHAILAAVGEETVTRTVELGPLSAEDTYTLIESMLGVGSDPRRLAARIYAETKGSPYFTVELMRALVESGSLRRRDGAWEIDLDTPGALAVPQTVAEVILERTRRTPAAEQVPLGLLAVLGRPAGVVELAALADLAIREVVAQLASLERRQVIYAERGGEHVLYDFIHEIARDAIYEAMDPAERISLHERCGDFLERRSELGEATVDSGDLVRHFAAAGDRARALQYGIRAADEARAVHAHHKAIAFYSEALALLPAGSARWRDLLQRTGDLLALTGDTGKAAEVYARLLAPERVAALSPLEATRARRRQGEILEAMGDLDGALEALAEAASGAYGRDGLERECAALFAATASIYHKTGRYADAIGFCEVALEVLVGLSEGGEVAQARTVLGRSRLALGELPQAEREFERCLAIERRLGNEVGVARALGDLGLVALEKGRVGEAASRFERALERETALGHAGGVAEAARRLAVASRFLCQYERAVSLLRRALTIHQRTGNRVEVVRVLIQLGRTHAALGDYEEAFTHLGAAREQADELELLAETARALNSEAALYAQLGAMAPAHERVSEALRRASLHGGVPRERAVALETLGRVQLLEGEPERAEQLFHEAQALFRKQEDPAGVLRTTIALVRLFIGRGERELTQASLAVLPEGSAVEAERAAVLLLRAEAAAAFPAGDERAQLGPLEVAEELAATACDHELSWRIAATRGRLRELGGDARAGLADLVEAMTRLRGLLGKLPAGLRTGYLELPACVALKEDFLRLRSASGVGA